MSSAAMEKAIKILKEKHKLKYGAPLGKRKCTVELSDECMGVGAEKYFRGRICLECRRVQLRGWHDKRVVARGGLKKRGRKPKVQTPSSESESEYSSDDEEPPKTQKKKSTKAKK